MLVRDLLRRKGSFVATITPSATIRELLGALAEHNVGAMIVSTDGATLAGVVSERDVVREMGRRPDDLLSESVEKIMTTEVSTAAEDDSLDRLMLLMTEQRVRHVPILAEARVVGIISIGDVVKSRIEELESERESLLGYIQSG